MKNLIVLLALLTASTSAQANHCYLTKLDNKVAVVQGNGRVLASWNPMQSWGGEGISAAIASFKRTNMCPALEGTCELQLSEMTGYLLLGGMRIEYQAKNFFHELEETKKTLEDLGVCR